MLKDALQLAEMKPLMQSSNQFKLREDVICKQLVTLRSPQESYLMSIVKLFLLYFCSNKGSPGERKRLNIINITNTKILNSLCMRVQIFTAHFLNNKCLYFSIYSSLLPCQHLNLSSWQRELQKHKIKTKQEKYGQQGFITSEI